MAENQNDPLGILTQKKSTGDPLGILTPAPEPELPKYQKAVQDDRSELIKTASSWWNNIVTGTIGETVRSVFDLAAQYPVAAPSFGGVQTEETTRAAEKFRQLPVSERLKIAKKEVAPVEKTIKKLRSTYTTEEEDRAISNFDISDGIGLNDMQALAAMSGRMALDMGLGALTGGTSFVLQGYQSSVDDFDESAKKAGIEPNENARGLYGIAGGVINGLLEKFAIDKLFGDTPAFKSIQRKVIADVLKNTANKTGKAAIDAIETAATNEIKKLTSDLKSKGIRAVYRASIEGGTEGVQAGLEDAAKFAVNAVQGDEVFNQEEIKKNFFKNILNSGVAGGVFGPVFGAGADVAFGRNINKQVLNDIADASTEEDFQRINNELTKTFDDNNFSQEERDIIMNNAKRYAEVKQSIPTGTPASVQRVAIPLIEERRRVDQQITTLKDGMQNLDESVKASQEEDIKMLEDKRSSINDEVRSLISGDTFNFIEEDGKYYKQVNNGPREEISRNRYDLEQIKKEQYATTEGQEPIQEGRAEGDISQRQRTQEEGAQGAPTQTDSRYRNISSEKAIGIPALLGSKVTYKLPGRTITGTLIQEGQTISVEDENGDVVAEIGNVDELSNETPESRNITPLESKVESTEQGFKVDGKELFNENGNPFDAVSIDNNGKVKNVVLTTAGGKRRKFRGRVAQDLAAQISAKEDAKAQAAQAKLDQEFALPTPTAPKVITTEPAIAKVTEDNLDQVDAIEGTPVQKKVLLDIKPVVKAISAAVRNITGAPVSVNIHNQESFGRAVEEAGGSQEEATARGFYMASDGSIHLNIDNIDSDTMLHEGFHPILDALEKFNPQVINELFDQLSAIPEAAQIIADAKANYEGEVTQKKEAITDFVAGVADGRIQLNPSNFQKIKAFILDMLAKIGLGSGSPQLMKVDNEADLIRLANFITERFRTGETITFENIQDIIGDETVDPINVSNIAVVNPAQFQMVAKDERVFKPIDIKWTPKGIGFRAPQEKSSLYDVVSKSGGAVVVINSDATGIGMKKGVLRQGGIGYTFIEQNLQDNIGFAASMDSKQTAFFKAVQEAARIRDEKFPDMKGRPVAIFVMVQAPEVMFGNAYGADYFIKSLSYALSHNDISTENAKADIISYFNSIKETNDTGRKYANSIDKLIKLIENSNLRSTKDRKAIYDLLVSNRENNEDKSPKFGFDARRVLFGQFFNKVGNAKNKPGGRLRDILDNDGFNHKDFYNTYGDENVIKSLEGRTEGAKLSDGGFAMTGFFVDPTMQESEFVNRSRSGKFQHKQFNGKFYGTDPFVLNGKYYVNEVFPEARFVDKNGKPVPVTTSTAGSMYARTKTEPQAIVERAKVLAEEKGPAFQKTRPTAKQKAGIPETRAKQFLKDQFRFGLLGKEMIRLGEKRAGELSAELTNAERLSKKAQELTKRYGTSVSKADIESYLTGENLDEPLPLDLAEALSEMRSQIDNLTERLIQLGVVDNPESIEYYRQNKGKYLLRSYEAINYQDDFMNKLGKSGLNVDNVAKKLKNVDKTVVDAALNFLANRAMAQNPSLTQEEAMKQARVEANEILSDSESFVMNKGLTGSTNIRSLTQRKDISPEIRALMGEYTDPIYNYYASIFKIASLTSSRQYLNSLKEYGMGKFLFEGKERPEEASVKIAAEGSATLEPLNGLYTFPEVKEALQKSDNERANIISQAAGRIRKFKTVYNPATHVKNLIGNMGFSISNGHWNYLPESFKYIKANISGTQNKELLRTLDVLNRYGVLNNAVGINELKSYFDRNNSVDEVLDKIYDNGRKKSTVTKAADAIGSVGKAMENAYKIEDDIFKILAFVNESNRYAKALYNTDYTSLTEQQKKDIDQKVSEIVKDTFPTFSRVPKFVKSLSKVAFMGNFLSFPAESIRVQYNSLKLAMNEIKSGNSRLKAVGMSRILGALTYNGILSSMVYYGYNLAGAGLTGMLGYLGEDDDDEKRRQSSINKNVVPWSKAKDIYVSLFEKGKLVYYDIGSLDSYSYQKTVWNTFWANMNNNKGFVESVSKAVAKGLDPWMELDFVYKNMVSLLNNDDGRGKQIWNPEATAMERKKQQMLFVGKQFSPGLLGSSLRLADAYGSGDTDKLMDEATSMFFARKYTVDLKKQFQNYIYVEGTPTTEVGFKFRLQNAQRIYTDAKRQGVRGEALEQKYKQAIDQYKSILMTAKEYYDAAIDGGVNPKDLRDVLKKSRIGSAELRAISQGSLSTNDRAYIKK
jgi:hypothetical protein